MVQSWLVVLPNFDVAVDYDEVTRPLNVSLALFVVAIEMVVVQPNVLVLQMLDQAVIVEKASDFEMMTMNVVAEEFLIVVGIVSKNVMEFAEFEINLQQLVCIIFSAAAIVSFEEWPLMFAADYQVGQIDGDFYSFLLVVHLLLINSGDYYILVAVFAGDEVSVVFSVAADDEELSVADDENVVVAAAAVVDVVDIVAAAAAVFVSVVD